MITECDLEDLGGDEIADDFTNALVAAIEASQFSQMVYDIDKGVFLRVTVERITEKEFDQADGNTELYSAQESK